LPVGCGNEGVNELPNIVPNHNTELLRELDVKVERQNSVCVNSATDALGLSHDGLSRHRAGLPAHLGAAVNKD